MSPYGTAFSESGYPGIGSYASVRDTIVQRLPFDGRKAPSGTSSHVSLLASPRQAAFLFLRPPEELRVEEQETLVKLRQMDAEGDRAYEFVQPFASMLRQRQGELLDEWLTQGQRSKLPELQSFAAGVEKDKNAVRAGLTWWINNGVVEGHVTTLKLIKRQGYGRAGLHVIRNTPTSLPVIRMIRWKEKVFCSGKHSLGVLSLCR